VSLWDRLATRREREAVAAVQNAVVPTSAITRGTDMFNIFTGETAGSGGLPPLSESTARTLTAAEACVGTIVGAIAPLPLNVYSRNAEGEQEEVKNHNLWWILNEQFAPRWSAAVGWEFLIRSRMYHGDAFAVIDRNRLGEIVGLEPIHPNRVTVYLTADKRLVYEVAAEGLPGEQRRIIDQDDMLHVPGDGFDGFRSPSPLRNQLKIVGAAALAMQEYNARFFSNGANVSYVLEQKAGTPAMSPTAVQELRAAIDNNHGGLANSRRPMILQGLEFKSVTMPLDDVQLLSLRQFAVEEIARLYRVPPFMIGHNEKTTSWGSGVEAMSIGFVRYTLRPHLNAFANEMNRKFFRTGKLFVDFDTTDLERADTKSMFESFRIALGGQGSPGFMSKDEVRARLKLKPVPGGDQIESGLSGAPAPAPVQE
jgi:HK97 family phage portal protein